MLELRGIPKVGDERLTRGRGSEGSHAQEDEATYNRYRGLRILLRDVRKLNLQVEFWIRGLCGGRDARDLGCGLCTGS